MYKLVIPVVWWKIYLKNESVSTEKRNLFIFCLIIFLQISFYTAFCQVFKKCRSFQTAANRKDASLFEGMPNFENTYIFTVSKHNLKKKCMMNGRTDKNPCKIYDVVSGPRKEFDFFGAHSFWFWLRIDGEGLKLFGCLASQDSVCKNFMLQIGENQIYRDVCLQIPKKHSVYISEFLLVIYLPFCSVFWKKTKDPQLVGTYQHFLGKRRLHSDSGKSSRPRETN